MKNKIFAIIVLISSIMLFSVSCNKHRPLIKELTDNTYWVDNRESPYRMVHISKYGFLYVYHCSQSGDGRYYISYKKKEYTYTIRKDQIRIDSPNTGADYVDITPLTLEGRYLGTYYRVLDVSKLMLK